MDRLESMEVFVRAVDLGSFAAAATALDLSGPMVGKHVRFLEEHLGVRLLNRTTRRQSLTDFGRAYYERCRIVLAEAQAADALAAEQLSEPRGKLRVTMPAHFGRHCVTPILLALARRYPTLELDLSLSDRFADLVEDGFDLAIRTGALDDRAGIIVRRVARQRMIVCASPSYLERIGRPLRLDDIAGHQAIIYRRLGQALQPWLFPRDGGSMTQIAPAGRLRLDDLDAIADAATDGMGLAWLPYWLVRERVEAGALVRLLPDQPDYLYDCHALWLQTPHLPLKVRLAVDALAAGLPRMMS
ncbi:LysR family transcriptional regulator [Mesorhizobium sp. M1C.F.Ca.ET.193.01.1.1]|uniref:LysR family transcriptional regulator n=2 Tax=Mesorhizobium TaxID=68287 RepID=UPI000FD49C81|nr:MULTISPECIES: LysR family transcriptional regulator [unclassified Mesorhizobium]TGS98249.1 LysR family transcriptional regulator [bacterium M00.F.Ca.ET.177.01.1.1]TGQ52647.1 LysR family transcriptional regulator [Mesorhizobium sp. M1C.F.Ca.ET.210.01.1.1]TGQ70030.1 LysR family transcriptional regulator [Mesorhizobium sp. M1C.F.Ca.ET.212.01.1.1]TGR05515.1 LysR family transcriptional regulator [Mesorhizobium sp. M1C.F.Ca.ET.204.01.1.1]TGR26266.1 LysR family transcriptional regulator [Mesorhizo